MVKQPSSGYNEKVVAIRKGILIGKRASITAWQIRMPFLMV